MAQTKKASYLIQLDPVLNESIRSELNIKKIKGVNVFTKEETMGNMVEERYELEKILIKKKMSFIELLTFLTKNIS